jgi:glycosyltransferase involved in cell wall biosynthesis
MTNRFDVAVFVWGRVDSYLPTVRSLQRATPGCEVIFGALDAAALGLLVDAGGEGAVAMPTPSAADLANRLLFERRRPLLLITAPVVLPPSFLDLALPAMEADARVAVVSFPSNAASYLSFPHRNQPTSHQIEGFDEATITERLRSLTPSVGPAPIPVAVGAVNLFSSTAASAVGKFAPVPDADPEVAVAELSLRAARRGFMTLLDASTFYLRPFDLAVPPMDVLADPERRQWLHEQHPSFPAAYDVIRSSDDAAHSLAMATGRAKVTGLRLLIDGTCLGPQEMGTQVQTLALIGALAQRDDVRSISVAVPGEVPRYAALVLASPKIDVVRSHVADFSESAPADVVHRPFQPTGPGHPSWRERAARTVVTVQDMIAFRTGAYHESGEAWLHYRSGFADAIAAADGVVVISDDTRDQLTVERLRIDAERVFVVHNGTDHMSGNEAATTPSYFLARGASADRFLLVLGANYAHKNRDLAIAAWQLLLERGHQLRLVIAGAAVPYGSSRVAEAINSLDDRLDVLPDISSEERNWLLRHADAVLYPTSNEGFGLVPYEAARFGTPTVAVPFGPLREVAGEHLAAANDWSPASLADATDELLADPARASERVQAILTAGTDLTWDRTAERLVSAYRTVLAQPRR